MSDAVRGAGVMRGLLLRWVVLLGGSMALAELLRRIGLPASAMLGPMTVSYTHLTLPTKA